MSKVKREPPSKRLMAVTAGIIAAAFFGCAAATTGAPESPGEKILVSKCGACHIRPDRDEFGREGWEKVLDKHENRVPLKSQQRRNLLEFLSGSEEHK